MTASKGTGSFIFLVCVCVCVSKVLVRFEIRTRRNYCNRNCPAAVGKVLTSQQQASVSQGRMCSDNFTYCHTEIEAADQTVYLTGTQSQYTDTGPISPSADPITPGIRQGSHWSANFLSHWYDSTPEKPRRKVRLMIIIIAFKGAIRDFLQSPHSAANCLQHIRSSGPSAIVC